MQVNPIQVRNFISFEKLPERRYPYELSNDSFQSQAEAQMPEARKDLKAYENEIDAYSALINLKKAMKEAEPYLDMRFKNVGQAKRIINRSVQRGLQDVNLPVKELTNLLACHAQSDYQQDKHDAIWLYNRMVQTPYFNRERGLFIMADAFKKLDRTFDGDEIRTAEANLKKHYDKYDVTSRVAIEEIYGNGKNLNFRA